MVSDVRENYEKADPITWVQIHNLLPIVIALVSVVAAYYIQSGQIEINKRDLERHEIILNELLKGQEQQNLILERINTKLGIANVHGISTSSALLKGVNTYDN